MGRGPLSEGGCAYDGQGADQPRQSPGAHGASRPQPRAGHDHRQVSRRARPDPGRGRARPDPPRMARERRRPGASGVRPCRQHGARIAGRLELTRRGGSPPPPNPPPIDRAPPLTLLSGGGRPPAFPSPPPPPNPPPPPRPPPPRPPPRRPPRGGGGDPPPAR